MRMSRAFIPTMKDAPQDVQIESHKLLIRAGMIHPACAGVFTLLPAGVRVIEKLAAVLERKLERIGAQQLHLPGVIAGDALLEAGVVEDESRLSVKDRSGRTVYPGACGDSFAVEVAAGKVESAKALPLTLFHRGLCYKDLQNPRGGLLRSREYEVLRGFCFHSTRKDQDRSFEAMVELFSEFFKDIQAGAVAVESAGVGRKVRFVIPSKEGDGEILVCPGCKYATDKDGGEFARFENTVPGGAGGQYDEVHTPGVTSISSLCKFLNVPVGNVVKSMVFEADKKPVMALVPGDRDLNPYLLRKALGARKIRQGDPELIQSFTGGPVGFSGPVGIPPERIVQDPAVLGIDFAVVGANRQDYHLTGVVPGVHFKAGITAPVTAARPGDPCPRCRKSMEVKKVFPVASVEDTGEFYTGPAGATVTEGKERRTLLMNRFTVGMTRLMGILAQENRDKSGIIWPVAAAPYQVVMVVVNFNNPIQNDVSLGLYRQLESLGIDTLLDDRDRKPGFKFKDADLLGIPIRLVVGRKAEKEGLVEIKHRRAGQVELCPVDGTLEKVFSALGKTVPTRLKTSEECPC